MSRSRRSAAEQQPEFFFDRSLGRVVASDLRARGWLIHLIADHYPNDAQDVEDVDWIGEGVERGWYLMTKDLAIRRRDHEAAAVGDSLLFALSNQRLRAEAMTSIFDKHRHRIEQRVRKGVPGIYVVSDTGVKLHNPSRD